MTAAELARYNLTRLVRESGLDLEHVARRAWPMPRRNTARLWGDDKAKRVKKLRRYLGLDLRDGAPVTMPLDELDNLARALGVPRAEFLREPA